MVIERLLHRSIRLILEALPPFVAHNVLLCREIRLIQFVDQISHSIRLEPERQLELVRGKGLEIIRAIKIRGTVEIACTCTFEVADVLVGFEVL